MELAGILFQQTIIMFLYMAVGIFLFKKKLVTKSGSGEIAKMLVNIIMPLVIVKAYMVEFTKERLIGLAISFVAAVASLFVILFVYSNKKREIKRWHGAILLLTYAAYLTYRIITL